MNTTTWMKIMCLFAALTYAGLADAQTMPRLKPIPPRGSRAAVAPALALSANSSTASPWQPLKNQPPFTLNSCNGGFPGAANPLLLTDGTVIVQDAGCQDWWRLTPDNTGSYADGTWTQIASLPPGYAPLYHSSAVLPDGRVIIMGGEYNVVDGVFFTPIWTAQGAIYDPIANVWTPVAPPPFFSFIQNLPAPAPLMQTIGDAQSVVLPNGVYMQADCCTKQQALLNSKTLTWTPTGSGKFDDNDEEGWTLLPSGEVLIGGWRDTSMETEKTLDDQPTPEIQEHLDGKLEEMSPGAEVTNRWAGIMGFTETGLPLVGPVDGMNNVYTCAGFNGHGMGFAFMSAKQLVERL